MNHTLPDHPRYNFRSRRLSAYPSTISENVEIRHIPGPQPPPYQETDPMDTPASLVGQLVSPSRPPSISTISTTCPDTPLLNYQQTVPYPVQFNSHPPHVMVGGGQRNVFDVHGNIVIGDHVTLPADEPEAPPTYEDSVSSTV